MTLYDFILQFVSQHPLITVFIIFAMWSTLTAFAAALGRRRNQK